MKVIVAGSRSITDYVVVEEAIIASEYAITLLISGGADGVDGLGVEWAKLHGVPYIQKNAVWRSSTGAYLPEAGKERNRLMAKAADACVAVWDGRSPGTSNMIAEMKILGKPVFVRRWAPEPRRADIL
jgi:predicted Rossmann fold nucleotide-binding protein DprA/Smf involved in DNA uptake